MKILVHDFAGHPFEAQLSRALADRVSEVVHATCSGVATGRGDLTRRPGDPPGLRFVDVASEPFERYAALGRLRSEVRYGQRLARLTAEVDPDVVLSANTPLLAQARFWAAARRAGAHRAYWVQDFLGRGTRTILQARSPALGQTVGRALESLETRMLRDSDTIVVIADDFLSELRRRGVQTDDARVIENWAPLDELLPSPKDTPWSRAVGIADRPVALYAGTLGLKHDPQHLVSLAEALSGSDQVLVVITEGQGRAVLEARRAVGDLDDNLVLLDYIDYDRLPDALGAADVALVLLESDAGAFSVPSKVLSYLAAGCAVVGAMPAENLATRTVNRAGAGTVVVPGDYAGFCQSVQAMLTDEAARTRCAASARRYAEANFDIDVVCDRMLDSFSTRSRPFIDLDRPTDRQLTVLERPGAPRP